MLRCSSEHYGVANCDGVVTHGAAYQCATKACDLANCYGIANNFGVATVQITGMLQLAML